jgi:triacylglycerol lipase
MVLVHGLLGYGEVRLVGLKLYDYFPGVSQALREAGNRVLVPSLSPTAGIAERAAQLKEFVDRESPQEPVHVIAHSMGGLDARFMISRLDMGGRVLSLTTLGTPHRGTTFADWGVARLGRIVRPILEWLYIPTQAFLDLTTSHCRQFNEQVPDVPDVRYYSVAGRHEGGLHTPEWYLSYSHVLKHEGVNDGIVSAASAKWGQSFEMWEGDHFSLVNWPNPFAANRGWNRNPLERYGPLVKRLADEGF